MKEITAKELEKKLVNGEPLHIIDVREDEEVTQGVIPGAKHIPLGELDERLSEIDKKETYYIVCRSGGRSSAACTFLDEHGFQVINMVGGMLAWEGDIH
ncbi:rhodanese-like domain-containing protein [Virgibacillus soli]|uniref:Rhodanese-like domain-containing protein n=1 Tax=Paracerasibacillus soli TaxID=480284 RepID=A0ABU5CTN0_9BACI|nr:rhodanese-like domain-containing protein [Virgibacillus soli]MDY0409689.1 rhodanese-like domain-containing protein [Virgibacillus soli]